MENTNILIHEITRKSEIVDNSTWVLANDGGQNVLIHRAPKDVAKALSDGARCFYVSPDVFEGDFHFDNVLFPEKSEGLSVDVSFRLKLLPEMSGFADWVKANVEYKLTKDEFIERIAKPKYGLKLFLQHALEGVTNYDLLRKHGKDAVPTFAGQDKAVEPWLYVVGMQWIDVDDIPVDKRNWLNEFSTQQEARSKELDQMRADLSFATEKGNLEDAFKVLAQRQKLNDLTREGALKAAEVENAKKELQLLKIKEQISTLTQTERDRYGKLEGILEEYHKAQLKIDELKDQLEKEKQKSEIADPDAWYNKLSVKGKIIRHVRVCVASVFYVLGYLFFLSGCGLRPKSGACHAFLIDFAFVKTVACWFLAMLLNSKSAKETLIEVKIWIVNLLHGRPVIDIAYVVGSFFRYLAGCYLVFCGILSVYWFFGLIAWVYLGFQKDFLLGPEMIAVAISGIATGAYVLGMKLLMRRKVCSSANSKRKWIMIIALPLLSLLFYDQGAVERFKWPNEIKKATRNAISEFQAKNYEKAWQWVEVADKSNTTLCTLIGDAYAHGYGVKANYKEAIKYYLKVENEKQNAEIEFRIGYTYYTHGDYDQSVSWLQKAEDKGFREASYFLGLLYETGEVFAKDLARALECYKKARNTSIKQMSVEEAIKRVKLEIEVKEAEDLEQEIRKNFNAENYKRVWQLIPKANQTSLLVLAIKGDCYFKGLGVKVDYLQAKKCYEKLWEHKKFSDLANSLGICDLCLGDYKEAARWFKIATDQGDANAWFYLGCLYEEGEGGLVRDQTIALECYRKALRTDNAEIKQNAKKFIERIEAKVKTNGSSVETSKKAHFSELFKPIK